MNATKSMIKEGWFWKSIHSEIKQDELPHDKLSELREESKSTQEQKYNWNSHDKIEDLPPVYINITSSNLKRSQSMRVSKRPQFKKEMETQRKYVSAEENGWRSSVYKGFSSVKSIPYKTSPREDKKDTQSKDVTEALTWSDKDKEALSETKKPSKLKRSQSMRVSKCPQFKEEMEKQRKYVSAEENGWRSRVYKGFSSVKSIPDKTTPREDEKNTQSKDVNDAWTRPDKDEEALSDYIKSSNLKRSQSMRVTKCPQLKEEMEKQRKYVSVEEDRWRSSVYKGFSSVKSIPDKASPRENEKYTQSKDVTEAWTWPDKDKEALSETIRPSNLKCSESMRVSKRPQLKEEMEKQRKYVSVEEDGLCSSVYKGFGNVKSIPSKRSPRENEKLQGFVKTNTITEENELSDLYIGETREFDIFDSTFKQKLDERPLMVDKPSILKRGQSMRIPKSRKFKDDMEKQRQCVTLEEADTWHDVGERRIRICPENEYDLTPQPKQQWQSLHPKEDRFGSGLNTSNDIKDLCGRNDRDIVLHSKGQGAIYQRTATVYAKKSDINSERDIVLHSKGQSANYQRTATVNAKKSYINSETDIVLHSKGQGTKYKVLKTATMPGLKHSSVVPTDSSLSYHREIKVSDDELIRIWRFGQTSEFITFPKEEKVERAIFKISKKLKTNNSALDLFYRQSILDKTDTLGDHIEVGKKDRVFVVEKQLSRQVPYDFLVEVPDMIDPYEDEIPRVLMSCGHGITCENLYEYCRRQIESGYSEFLCPSVPDLERPHEQCGSRWDFMEVRKKACLSDDESNMFEMMLSHNKIQQSKDIHQCPQCYKYIESVCCRRGFVLCKECDGNYSFDFKFCVLCQRKWVNADDSNNCGHVDCKTSLKRLQKILMTCPTKDIVGIQNCPTVRACPQCNYIVEHEGDNCKHMDCPSQYCRTKFCFVCLQIQTDKYYWPDSCGGAFIHCQLAPRQSV